ncbi:MAG: hypothetical protein NTX52_08070 [Planctomycetota bacterium]|nr:hypothetical protein [Planctomycetota bacterium]
MYSIWAVATNTIKQALRMKIAAVFIILLIILLPIMGVTATGDGTIKGRLQTFVSYGLSLTSLLLCLLTIIVSIYSLTSDIQQKQIYTVITKPIRRFQLLLGKLLGVILLDVALLVLFAATIYAITIYIPRLSHATEEQQTQLNNEFFTARTGLVPAEVDVTQEVLNTYKQLEKGGQLGELFPDLARKEIIAQLTTQKKLEKRAAAVGQELLWEFHKVRPLDPNESLFIKFKYDVSVNPPDSQVYSQWLVGDYRQVYGTKIETRIYSFERKDAVRTSHEIQVPADTVAQDGYLAVGFLNVPLNNTVVIFPHEAGLEVLYKADTFTANFVRAALLILCRLIFLACLGVLAATFLSFPVAILFCLVFFLTASFSGFVIESFDFLGGNLSSVYSYTLKPVIGFLPQFDKFNPTKFLVPGRLLSWSLVGKAAGLMVCIRVPLLLLLGLLIFSYKEIAKIIV